MKIFITISLLLYTLGLNANELSWVDKQIEAIKPPRNGLKNGNVELLNDPFIFLKKNQAEKDLKKSTSLNSSKNSSKSTNKDTNSLVVQKKKMKFSLVAIINKSALINGQWYKHDSLLNGYKLSIIDPQSVILIKKTKKILLSTRSINKKLNFKYK